MNFIKNINIPSNVNVDIIDNLCTFSGPKGVLSYKIHKYLSLEFKDNNLLVLFYKLNLNLKKRDLVFLYSVFNTDFANLKNCLFGVLNFFEYFLSLKGIGYKASYDKTKSILVMLLGFSHPVEIKVPNDILLELPNNSEIIIKSVSKSRAGQFAANLKFIKLPDNYKGNGIKFKDEKIILKTPKKTK